MSFGEEKWFEISLTQYECISMPSFIARLVLLIMRRLVWF